LALTPETNLWSSDSTGSSGKRRLASYTTTANARTLPRLFKSIWPS